VHDTCAPLGSDHPSPLMQVSPDISLSDHCAG
jgi:hypothetical protein